MKLFFQTINDRSIMKVWNDDQESGRGNKHRLKGPLIYKVAISSTTFLHHYIIHHV